MPLSVCVYRRELGGDSGSGVPGFQGPLEAGLLVSQDIRDVEVKAKVRVCDRWLQWQHWRERFERDFQ